MLLKVKHSGGIQGKAFVETTLFSHVSNSKTFNFDLKENENVLYLIYTIAPQDAFRCSREKNSKLTSIKTLINTNPTLTLNACCKPGKNCC